MKSLAIHTQNFGHLKKIDNLIILVVNHDIYLHCPHCLPYTCIHFRLLTIMIKRINGRAQVLSNLATTFNKDVQSILYRLVVAYQTYGHHIVFLWDALHYAK